MPLLNPAPAWVFPRSSWLTVWHGCTTVDKIAIENGGQGGIDPSRGRAATDFGRGFYTTTIKRQARQWAWARYYHPKFKRQTNYQPVILRFEIDRFELAELASLSFCLGSAADKDFWSLVQHCRGSTSQTIHDHAGPVSENGQWYDVVSGPVAAFWKQCVAMRDADQISFHTTKGAGLLNKAIQNNKYKWFPVTP
ncbi:MAG TPA: DUF3990 domain-containing protein [Pirellulales bacterium]